MDGTKRSRNILPANWEDDDVVVEHHANDEDAEAKQLKSKEVLPTHTNAKTKEVKLFRLLLFFSMIKVPDHPDHKGPDTVEHHTGGG